MNNEKLLSLPNERTLSYEGAGLVTSSLVVVFFRGTLTVGQAKLSPVLTSLGAHYISPTLPGYGNRSPPAEGVSYATTIQSDISALLDHLHPNKTDMQLYIGGGSFGTVPAQMLYGAPFDAFPAGRNLKGLLLLGAFPPFKNDKEKGFVYTRNMTWGNYISIGPLARILPFRLLGHLTKLAIGPKISTQEKAEAFIHKFVFEKMGDKEKEIYAAWRQRKGYEVGQLEREMAQLNRRSVEKSWEGLLSTAEVVHGDWGWAGRGFEDLDSTLQVGTFSS